MTKYYFDNNINRNNPVEYLNDNINAVLISIMDYYKSQGQSDIVKLKKNETFLLSVIICVASFVDIASNVIDGNYPVMKRNLVKLLKYLNKTEILKIYWQNKIILNKLFKEVKQNINNEKKFFELFKSNKYHNEYQIVSQDPLYYKVRFIYKVEGLENEDNKIIKKLQHEYLKNYLKICYELLVILLMKEYIMNKEVNTYLLPVLDLDEDLNILKHPLIKDNVKLLVPIEKYEEFKNSDFNIVYTLKDLTVEQLLDKQDIEVLVKKEFREKNKEELSKLESLKIKLIVENLGKSVTDKMIYGIKEEVL